MKVCTCLFAVLLHCILTAADEIPANQWIKLHKQRADDAVHFRRQAHGGSCFDAARGRMVLFGSDTHGGDWTNSPLVFEVEAKRWSRVYPNDDPATYAVDEEGVPVAGEKGDHPWAMHTFGTVMYDPGRDEMIVACAPKHMVPGRFTNAVKDLWPKIKRHPTWTFNLKGNDWQPLRCEPIDFFPHSAAFDTDRNVVLGYRPDGIYELSGEPRTWKRLTKRVFVGGWHSNCVYDSKNKALVVFGTNTNSNDVEVFFPADGKHQLMPTTGRRPPKDQHNPMAFHSGIGKTVVLVDHRIDENQTVTESWLYDLSDDSWSQLDRATLRFGCGMNYNLEYDPIGQRLILVIGDRRQPTTVWTMRLQTDESAKEIGPVGEIEKLHDGFRFTEGPADDGQGNLYFSDIPANRIYKVDQEGDLSVFLEDTGGINGLMFDADGTLYACQGGKGRVVTIDVDTKKMTTLADKTDGQPLGKPNDLVLDKQGGIYFTDPGRGAIYYLDHEGKVTPFSDGIKRPNGVILSPDEKTLYVIPSGQPQMMAYSVSAPGKLSKPRVFCTIEELKGQNSTGGDGAAVDMEGNIYIATRAGVQVFDSSGKPLKVVRFPGFGYPKHPSNVTFGGPRQRSLFITARDGLYRVPMNARGHVFMGRTP